ncbi:hypothetical protein [Ensifer aridi]|uniref:hypothetical protein n=1 Tax=Ensifer aridi TaxID=1708715 RepID=UPI001FCD5986|nr:hypothetical protein [Ensifer aridi]
MPTFRDNESAIAYLSEVVEMLNEQMIKAQGENMVMKSMIKRLMMLVVLPRQELCRGWDEALDIDRGDWTPKLEQANEPTRAFIQAAIDLLAYYETSSSDPDPRNRLRVLDGGLRD